MSNEINENGIVTETYDETVDAIVNGAENVPGYKEIYGDDINVDSDTPDGQQINIYALSKQDILNLIIDSYNSKDPDQAIGVALDHVSEYCGIFRRQGTYTEVYVTVTTDRNLTLNGSETASPFTVSDLDGNEFYLKATASCTTGDNSLLFQAVNIGEVQVLPNTITNAITILLGVTAVNNPLGADSLGVDEETDAELRIRRQNSVAMPASGYIASLEAGLYEVTGVLFAKVYENSTGSTDADGIPANSIWAIMRGGLDAAIAAVIYNYKAPGCGMHGSESVNVTQADSSTYTINFTRATAQDLYLQFELTSINGGSIDYDTLKTQLETAYTFTIYEAADITTLAGIIRGLDENLVVFNAGVSDDGITYDEMILPTTKDKYFTISAANIDIVGATT